MLTNAVMTTAGDTDTVTGWEVPQIGQTSSKNRTSVWHALQVRHSLTMSCTWLRTYCQTFLKLQRTKCINLRPSKMSVATGVFPRVSSEIGRSKKLKDKATENRKA